MCTWIVPRGPLELKGGEIHLWRVDLDHNRSSLAALDQTLAPAERREAKRFRLKLDRHRYLLARAVLKTILARYLEMAPHELGFCYRLQGKPEVGGSAVRFSVSYSHDLALYA